MIMFPLDATIESLQFEEGFSAHCYLCTAGAHTIGHGRNISKGGIGISRDEAVYLLKNDVQRVVDECAETFSFWENLSPKRKRALVEICFQIGKPRLLGFRKALAAMEAEDYRLAADEFLDSKWAQQTPARAHRMAALIFVG